MRRHGLCALIACLAVLAPAAAPATAQVPDRVLVKMVKQLREKGRIDPCAFTSKELAQAQKSIPPDIEQYAPDIKSAIDNAVQARARGACRKGGSKSTGSAGVGVTPGAGTTTPGAGAPAVPQTTTPPAQTAPAQPGQTSTPQPTPDPQPAPAAADDAIPEAVDAAPASSTSAGDAPAPLILLILLGAILLAAAALAASVRWLAWEPAWLDRARHATAEAGWRTSAAWAEFTDWVRLGR